MASSKVQNVEVTVRWHNRYLGCAVVFFLTTALFAGLFGHYYLERSRRPPCDDDAYWVFGNSSEFDDACHTVGDDGLYAIEGASCPTDCDAWWHARHSTWYNNARRLMQVKVSDPKSLKSKFKNKNIVKQRGRVYVINKMAPGQKSRQY